MKRLLISLCVLVCSLPGFNQENIVFEDGVFTAREGLKITLPRSFVRFSFLVDPVEASILEGKWRSPKKGGIIQVSDTIKAAWEPVASVDEGWFRGSGYRNGWVYISLQSPVDQIVLLEGMGHNMVYINGIPRMGNKYQSKDEFESWEPKFNFSRIPVKLIKGKNDLLFKVTRGRLKVKLHEPASSAQLNVLDQTLPDLIQGEDLDSWGAIVVINAGEKPLEDAFLKVSGVGLSTQMEKIPDIPPMSIKKVPFRIQGNRKKPES